MGNVGSKTLDIPRDGGPIQSLGAEAKRMCVRRTGSKVSAEKRACFRAFVVSSLRKRWRRPSSECDLTEPGPVNGFFPLSETA